MRFTGLGWISPIITLIACCGGIGLGAQYTDDRKILFAVAGLMLLLGAAVVFAAGFLLNGGFGIGGYAEHTVGGLPLAESSIVLVVMAYGGFTIALTRWLQWWAAALLLLAVTAPLVYFGYRLATRAGRLVIQGRSKLAEERGWRFTAFDADLPFRWAWLLGKRNWLREGILLEEPLDKIVSGPIRQWLEPPDGGKRANVVAEMVAPDPAVNVVQGEVSGHGFVAFDIALSGTNCTVWAVRLPAAFPKVVITPSPHAGYLQADSDEAEFGRRLLTPAVTEMTLRDGLVGWRISGDDLLLVRRPQKPKVDSETLVRTAELLAGLITVFPADLVDRFGRTPEPAVTRADVLDTLERQLLECAATKPMDG